MNPNTKTLEKMCFWAENSRRGNVLSTWFKTNANFLILFLKVVPSLCMSVIMSNVAYKMPHIPAWC